MSSMGDPLEDRESPAPPVKSPSPEPSPPSPEPDPDEDDSQSTVSTGKRKKKKKEDKPKGDAEGIQMGRTRTIDPDKVTDFQVPMKFFYLNIYIRVIYLPTSST